MNRVLATALRRLLTTPGDVPGSAFTQAQRSELEIYGQRTGAVRAVRKGVGNVFRAVLPDVVRMQLDTIAPSHMEGVSDDLPNRARNIAMTRSSKGGRHGHDRYHLVLKPIGAGGHWNAEEGRGFDLAETALATGAAILPGTPEDTWATDGNLWLVENQAMFDHLDWLGNDVHGSLAYFAGTLHGTLLRWLERHHRAARVIVFPDYDGNGMACFSRACQASAAPCELHLFPGWQSALERYGNPDLHKINLPALESAIASMPPEARDQATPLVEQMIRTGKALEQEAIWLGQDRPVPRLQI
jgi:hypothetical protein